MSQDISGGKKTILFIRSSSVYDSLELFRRLRQERHPDGRSRWILILQPQVEREFAAVSEGVDVTVIRYEGARFSYGALKKLFQARNIRDRIDAAYVPFNNPEGRGYFQILMFLANLNIPEIFGHISGDQFERITPGQYAIRRAKDILPDAIETLIFVLVLPFALLFTAMRSLRGQIKGSI